MFRDAAKLEPGGDVVECVAPWKQRVGLKQIAGMAIDARPNAKIANLNLFMDLAS